MKLTDGLLLGPAAVTAVLEREGMCTLSISLSLSLSSLTLAGFFFSLLSISSDFILYVSSGGFTLAPKERSIPSRQIFITASIKGERIDLAVIVEVKELKELVGRMVPQFAAPGWSLPTHRSRQ